MSSLSSMIDILPVTLSDLPILSSITALAMRTDKIESYLFLNHVYPTCDNPNPKSTTAAIDLVKNQLRKHISNPASHVFKACLKSSGDPIGHASITRHETSLRKRVPEQWPEGCRTGFCEYYWGQMVDSHNNHINFSMPYIEWNSFFVHPMYQKYDLGFLMLQWAFKVHKLDTMQVWVCTTKAHTFFRKYGWEEIEVIDIDLRKWDDTGEPFQSGGDTAEEKADEKIYHMYSMLRQPGRLVKSGSGTVSKL